MQHHLFDICCASDGMLPLSSLQNVLGCEVSKKLITDNGVQVLRQILKFILSAVSVILLYIVGYASLFARKTKQ